MYIITYRWLGSYINFSNFLVSFPVSVFSHLDSMLVIATTTNFFIALYSWSKDSLKKTCVFGSGAHSIYSTFSHLKISCCLCCSNISSILPDFIRSEATSLAEILFISTISIAVTLTWICHFHSLFLTQQESWVCHYCMVSAHS